MTKALAKKMAAKAAIVAVAGVGAVAGLAAPAQADWNGNCSTTTRSTSAWGWCDGTGPQRYAIFVLCNNNGVYKSSRTPWFGDRNGATAYCPSGTYAVSSWGGRA